MPPSQLSWLLVRLLIFSFSSPFLNHMYTELHGVRVTFNMYRGFLKKAKAQEDAAPGLESALPVLTLKSSDESMAQQDVESKEKH